MFNIKIDTANTRPWSDGFLNLVEGTALLLGVFEERPESAPYRAERENLRQQAGPPLIWLFGELDELSSWLRAQYTGSQDAEDLPEDQHVKLFELAMQFAPLLLNVYIQQDDDSDLIQWISKLIELFSEDVDGVGFVDRLMLSDWNAGIDSMFDSSSAVDEDADGLDVPMSMLDGGGVDDTETERLEGIVEFIRGVVELCWRYQLRSALAPIFIVLDDVRRLAPQPEVGSNGSLDVERLLNELFPRSVAAEFSSKGTVSPEPNTFGVKEWLLLMMSPSEMRGEFGKTFYEDFRERLEQFGYSRKLPWAEGDFEMLYARQVLGLSIAAVAECHGISDVHAQRRIAALVETLKLDPPRRAKPEASTER